MNKLLVPLKLLVMVVVDFVFVLLHHFRHHHHDLVVPVLMNEIHLVLIHSMMFHLTK
jgi:hypothetical protein